MKVVLIPCAATEWVEKGRLMGRVELSAGPALEQETTQWATTLAGLGLKEIYHAPDELATRTARQLGRKLVVPTRSADGLAEVDVGLWTGLTEDDLKSRYASAHRELCEAPLNVSPPGGENLGEADERLKAFLRKQAKRNGEAVVGLVLRPVSFAMAQCALEGRAPSALWETAKQRREPVVLDAGEALAGTKKKRPARPS
ncbi:MAG: histidine phosphatase family protein [Phycisphaerae bacterium]|jgi:broad specificity phosphatase PhoE